MASKCLCLSSSSSSSLSFSHSYAVSGLSLSSTPPFSLSILDSTSTPPSIYCGRGDRKTSKGKRFNHSFGNLSIPCFRSTVQEITQISTVSLPLNSIRPIKLKRKQSHLSVAESDHIITDQGENSNNSDTFLSSDSESPVGPSTPLDPEIKRSSSPENQQSTPKRAPLTARERLRAARVLNRYSDPKPAKSEMGRSVLDALRESDKGKKGLPEAPTNLFDDSKRGLPKAGLTFNFPGGFDLFIIAFSFVFISTVMFATTYLVWKVGAIHFNEY